MAQSPQQNFVLTDEVAGPPVHAPPGRPGRCTNQLQFLKEDVLNALCHHELSWPFLQPVNAEKLGLPDYYQIITNPMDFGTINKRLSNNYYWSAEECIKDIKSVFANCYLYNQPGHRIITMAEILETMFVTQMENMPEEEHVIN